MTRHPSLWAVKLVDIPTKYGATYLRDALARFVVAHNNPALTPGEVESASASVFYNFRAVHVFHKIKFWVQDPHGFAARDSESRDVIHARPARQNKYGSDIPGRFDTALVRVRADGESMSGPPALGEGAKGASQFAMTHYHVLTNSTLIRHQHSKLHRFA